jgi:hypothetical protein
MNANLIILNSSIITDICNAYTVEDAHKIYTTNIDRLSGWKFILAASAGFMPGFAINKTFSNGAAIRSLFASDHFFVLDELTVQEMNNFGTANISYDYSISFDTMAISYIMPFLENRNNPPTKDFIEVFNFIARNNVNVDPIPYILENQCNLSDAFKIDKIFKKLLGYEILCSINLDRLINSGYISSNLSEQELMYNAQQLMSRIIYDSEDKNFTRENYKLQRLMYCILLKMVAIQFNLQKMFVPEKLAKFIEFLDNDLCSVFARELIVALEYFERGSNLKFFGKIHPNRSDIFDNLKNMAWDLLHVRLCEKALTYNVEKDIRYNFPAFLTFDKALVEIIELYPLKSCAISPDGAAIPFYSRNMQEVLANALGQTCFFNILELFTIDATKKRNSRHNKNNNLIEPLIYELENIVATLANVDVPKS